MKFMLPYCMSNKAVQNHYNTRPFKPRSCYGLCECIESGFCSCMVRFNINVSEYLKKYKW